MELSTREVRHTAAAAALSGLKLGILGGVLMLAWYAIACPVLGQAWWTIPNGWASRYYSDRIRFGPGSATLFGSALHITIAGAVGAVGGLLVRWNRLLGLATATLLYLVSYLYWWPAIAPALPAYSPQAVLMFGYFIYGSALGLAQWSPSGTVKPR